MTKYDNLLQVKLNHNSPQLPSVWRGTNIQALVAEFKDDRVQFEPKSLPRDDAPRAEDTSSEIVHHTRNFQQLYILTAELMKHYSEKLLVADHLPDQKQRTAIYEEIWQLAENLIDIVSQEGAILQKIEMK